MNKYIMAGVCLVFGVGAAVILLGIAVGLCRTTALCCG